MAFSYDQLMSYEVPETRQTLMPRDCILYALSVGLGAEPTDPGQLQYVYERGLKMLPMQTNVLAYPGFWMKSQDTGVDWKQVLHGEQRLTIHGELPVEASLVGRTRVVGINDKGPERGAFVYTERKVYDRATNDLLCTLEQTSVLRGDGGCGGSDPRPYAPHSVPDRGPDAVCDIAVAAQAALIYRLNGDMNPLHADPDVAAAAGFPQPILHGLCTFAHGGHAVLQACCDHAPGRIRSMAVRFTAPMFPGETLRTEIWQDGNVVSFQSRALERDVIVLGNGRVELTAS